MSRTHHFFVEGEDITGDIVVLRGEQAHHAGRVLRIAPGERITVADGSGAYATATVVRVSDTVEARIEARTVRERPRPEIVLVQALAKADALDALVDHAVEVGVTRIVPFAGARSVVKWDGAKRQRAEERWRAVALAAAKRCGSPWRTAVDPVASDVAAAIDGATGTVVVLDPAAALRLRDVLPADAPDAVTLVVGPEGGLTEVEVATAAASGARPASLGELVLRTETAGSIAAALVAAVYGRLG